MGITKKHLYTRDQIEIAELFKAMAHPARIAIVEILLTHDNLNCNDLRKYIPLAQSTISQHIKQLHTVGILALNAIDNNAYYIVRQEALEEMVIYIKHNTQQISAENKKYLYANPVFKFILGQPVNNA